LKRSGCSIRKKWLAPSKISVRAFGSPSLRRRVAAGEQIGSAAPAITSVGCRMRARSPPVSCAWQASFCRE
jgi:hypothetical protein